MTIVSPTRCIRHCLCLLLLIGLPLLGTARHVRVRRVTRRAAQQNVSTGNSTGGNSTGGNSTGIINELIVLGDSYSDTGRFFALTNGTHPDPRWYWQGRYSSGPIWVDYLAAAANGLPYAANDTNYPVTWDNTARPTLSGLNYTAPTSNGTALKVVSLAVGGAPACYQNRDFLPPDDSTTVQVPWLDQQISDYVAIRSGVGVPSIQRNVTLGPSNQRAIVIEFGGNDYLNQFKNLASNGDLDLKLGRLPALISSCIKAGVLRLLALGEKNFVITSLPNVDRLPQVRYLDIEGLTDFLREQAGRTNAAIQQVVMDLQANNTHNNTSFHFYPLNEAIDQILVNAAEYNFTNPEDSCLKYSSPTGDALGKIPFVGDDLQNAANKLLGTKITAKCNEPDTHVFHDRVHPTSHTHSLIGRDIAAHLQLYGLR